jgi:microcystin degradation protein MlrC
MPKRVMSMLNILTAELTHETNTFCAVPTTEASFSERTWLIGDAAISERGAANTALAGFLDVGRTQGWNVIHVLSADAQPSGPVTRAAFVALTAPIIAAAAARKGAVDGVLLGLHGAMVTDFCEDGEGELLQRLRQQLGPMVPIAITLDPHANVTRKMCDLANIMVAYKTYPHVDMRLAGKHAANILQRAMVGEIQPVTLRVSRPMLEEVNGGRTDIGPMIERLAQARRYEQDVDVFAVSVNGGFANADIAEVGPSVLVTCQGDLARHARFASGLADDIWSRRGEPLNHYLTVTQAAVVCASYIPKNAKPIVVADYADNPGAGAYGDSTALLAALLAAGVTDACFGGMTDPVTIQQLQSHSPGDTVRVRLGGKTDPRFGGGPLDLDATLIRLSDGHYVGSGAMYGGLRRSWGPTAVIGVNGIEILVVSLRGQLLDLEQFRAFGIYPENKRVVVLKSMQHFRAAFEPLAGEVIVCDSGALCTLDYARLPFVKAPRPLFPFDLNLDLDRWMVSNNQGVYIPTPLTNAAQIG